MDRYWVGGAGTWNTVSTANWSATSGGGSGASVPTVADNVFFDQAGTYTVTMTGALACLDITVSAGTVTFATGTSPTLEIRGSMTLLAGTVWSSTGSNTFTATTTGKTVTTNGTTINGPVSFNGSSGEWTLGSALIINNANLVIAAGSFNTSAVGSYSVSCTQFNSNNSNTRTVSLNASTVTVNSSIATAFLMATTTGLTFNAGTSQINLTATTSGISTGGLTFYNVAFTSTATGTKTITGTNTFNNFTVTGPASAGVVNVTFDSRQTINGTLSTTGTAGNRRVFFTTANYGISQDLVVNSAPSLTDADFRGLYVRGTAAPISGTRIGNRGECRGITFDAPKTVFLVGSGPQNFANDVWAQTSGGSSSLVYYPLAQDTAVIDNFVSAGSSITSSNVVGYLPGVDASLRTSSVTISFNSGTTIYGSWTNGSGVTFSNSATLTFSGGTTQTITSAGKTFTCPITIDTYGGTVELADALNIGSSNELTITNGTFTTAGYAVTMGRLLSTNSNVRAINFGASTVTIAFSGGGTVINLGNNTNLTFNAGTSTITASSSGSNNMAFATGTGPAITLHNFVVGGSSTSAQSIQSNNTLTFNNLTINPVATIRSVDINCNIAVNGTLTCAGTSAVQRIFLQSDTIGTPRTLTVNAISATDCDFRDINLAGAASGASPTRAGDCGGNTGITFPAPKTVYWNLAGAQDWSATAWASGSGGTPDINNFPLAQDTAVFDDTGSVTGTITINAAWNIGTFDASLRTGAMTLTTSTNRPLVYGDWKFGTGVTASSTTGFITFVKNGTQTITSNGVEFGTEIVIGHINGIVQLADALFINSSRQLSQTAGIFDAVTYNVTTGTVANISAASTLRMGTGTWTLTGTVTVWNFTVAPTLVAGTSTIVLSNTSTAAREFRGGGLYYNKLTIGGATGTSTLTITGNNTFGELASTKTVAHTIAFGTTNHTFGKWSVTGTAGNVVTITGTSGANTIAGPAVTGIDYLAMGSWAINASSPGEFYAGANSTGTAAAPVFRTAAPAPRTLYWVGGTGNWSSTTKWSTSSGGGSGAAIPTSLDAVIFDAMSNAIAYTATIDAGVLPIARCASFTMAGPLVGNVTFAGTVPIAFHGNVSFAATGITRTYSGAMNWAGNGSYTFTTNGLTLSSNCTVNGIGSTWTLGSALNIGSNNVLVTFGSFDTSTSNYSVTFSTLSSSTNNVRSIFLNGSTLSSNTSPIAFNVNTNLLFNAGTSTISTSSSAPTFIGALSGDGQTFNNVSFTNTVTSGITITGANTFNTLSFAGRTSVGIASVTFNANQTISTLTLNAGTASAYRTFLASSTIGTTRTLTVGALTAGAADIDFCDITIAGAAAPISGTRFGDAKGNSGITFDAAKTVFYRQTGSANWGATGSGSWSDTSGSALDATKFPLAQDTAVFPAATYPSSGSTTTINANYNIGTIDMSLRTTNTLTLATSTNTPQIYGNWINGTGTTLNGSGRITYAGRGSQTITSAGKTFTQQTTVNSLGGSVTLLDSWITSSGTANSNPELLAGAFDAAGYNVTLAATGTYVGVVTSGTLARTLAIGSGTWTLSGAGNQWNISSATNLTVTGTGTISLTSGSAKTFTGGSVNYSGITLNQGGAGALTISGNNTFKTITNTYSATGATTIALGATTQTLTNPWTATGEAGRVLTVSGTSAASPATLIFSGGGQAANVDYLAINNVRAYDLVDEWYAGPNSTNGGSLGWYFIAAGGTVYAVTITETGTGTDAITARVTLLGTISETGTGTDTVSSSFLFVGSVNETSTITDSNFAAFQPKANITETVTGSDVESAILAAIGLINETATGTDAETTQYVARPAISETATGTDTETARYVANPAINETATGADAETARYLAFPVINESATGTDAEAAQYTTNPAVNETATGSDSDSALMTARSVVSETATGTDTDSASLSANSNISETATAADAVSAFIALLASVSEAATATDLVSAIKGLFAYIVESASITDAVNAPGSTYNPSLSETATATDSISALALFAVQVAESASITDIATAFKAYLAAILEAASGSDAVFSSFTARSAINETATGADTDAAAFTARSSVSETAAGTEIVSSLRTLRPSIAETAAGTDAASTRNTTNPAIAEAATGTDAPTTTAEFQSQVTETSVAQDIVLGFMVAAVQVSESATGSDQISALRALAAAVVEAVSGSDTVSATAVFQGILQEIATLTDSVNAPGSTYSAPVVELATLQDAVRAAATFPTAVTETATGTEINSAAFTPLVQIIETATITDAASALAAFAARTAESANITDEVSPPGSIYNPVVLAVATMLDSVNAPGSIYNPRVVESAAIADSLIGGFLWNLIDDSQTPDWGAIDDTQVASWVSVDDTQSVSWQNVPNSQTPGWTDVNDDQTPGWTPILP